MTTRATPYARLGDHLAAQHAAGVGRVTLTFAAIEALIGRPLSPSARVGKRGRAWWGRDGGQSFAWDGWLRVGWTVAVVDLAGGTVTFARRGAE